MNAKEFLDKLRGGTNRIEGVLLNTTEREGNDFWYQLRGEDGKIHLQFKAAGWFHAMEFIKELNGVQDEYKYIVTGTVQVPCANFEPRTIYPDCQAIKKLMG